MAGRTHEKQLARARAARAAQQEAERRARRVRVVSALVGLVVVLGLVGVVVLATRDGDERPAAGDPVVDGCVADSGEAAVGGTFEKPEKTLDEGAHDLVLRTNCGDIRVALAQDAPLTTDALAFLAAQDYFDHTRCHRLTSGSLSVLQCGDPQANGTGGPGFRLKDENLPEADDSGLTVYRRGTVAMANSGPDTAGSQFFLVHEDSPLQPTYTVVGEITEGLDVLDRVAAAGTVDGGADGSPRQVVELLDVTTEPRTTDEG